MVRAKIISFSRRPRLLPVAIGLMGLLLIVKAAALLGMPGAPLVLHSAGRAMLPAARAQEAAPVKPPAARGDAKPTQQSAPAKPGVANTVVPAAPAQEPGPSGAERAVLMDLRARRATLDERAGALDQREALAAAAERRLTDRLDQLTVLQTRLEALDQTRRERDEANWRGLVKTYETMRPRDAAAIFNDLDQAVLLQVLDRMKETKAAPVLAAMQPERARGITLELAKWRSRTVAGQP